MTPKPLAKTLIRLSVVRSAGPRSCAVENHMRRTDSILKHSRLVPAMALTLLAAAPAGADLVVLVDGSVMKVTTYRVEAGRARMELPSGGALTLPLGRIERVLDDEIVPEAELESGPTSLGWSAELSFADAAVPATPYGALIHETGRRHDLNPALIAAMVRAESAFDPWAVSHKGAQGLLQLMPATARRFGVPQERLFVAAENLDAGVRYLKWLQERFEGDLVLMLAAYNAGEANVDRHAGVPPFRETRDYIRRVMSTLGLEVN